MYIQLKQMFLNIHLKYIAPLYYNNQSNIVNNFKKKNDLILVHIYTSCKLAIDRIVHLIMYVWMTGGYISTFPSPHGVPSAAC